jgi:hypothetical protein
MLFLHIPGRFCVPFTDVIILRTMKPKITRQPIVADTPPTGRVSRAITMVRILLLAGAVMGVSFSPLHIPMADAESSSPPSGHVQKIVGRWLRPDGGYIIEIKRVENDGKLQAAYFNPRPINVSQAQVVQKDHELVVFIELRDVGYPGATYALTYDAARDLLAGRYYQPSLGQTFEVYFVRTP